jgi:hypothetical protein
MQLIGSIAITAGAYLVYAPSAIVLGGSFLILFGIAMERRIK